MRHLDELNPYSRRFAERLLAAHPEWERGIDLADYPPDFEVGGLDHVEIVSWRGTHDRTLST